MLCPSPLINHTKILILQNIQTCRFPRPRLWISSSAFLHSPSQPFPKGFTTPVALSVVCKAPARIWVLCAGAVLVPAWFTGAKALHPEAGDGEFGCTACSTLRAGLQRAPRARAEQGVQRRSSVGATLPVDIPMHILGTVSSSSPARRCWPASALAASLAAVQQPLHRWPLS